MKTLKVRNTSMLYFQKGRKESEHVRHGRYKNNPA